MLGETVGTWDLSVICLRVTSAIAMSLRTLRFKALSVTTIVIGGVAFCH